MKKLIFFALLVTIISTAVEYSRLEAAETKCTCNKPKPKPRETIQH